MSGKFAQTDFEKIQDSDISHHLFPVQKEERFIEEEVKTEEKENYIINPNILGTVSFEEVERELIEKTLKKFNFKKRQTANSLKISERTLYRKIKEYGL